MDFDLSEEQSILRDTLDRLLSDKYGFEARRGYLTSAEGWSGDMWKRYAEMGLMALPFSEADGGLGGGATDMMIVMESLSRFLALEPFFTTVVVGGGFLKHGGSNAQRAALIPLVADGSLKLAFAHTERDARYDLHHVGTTAQKHGDGYRLSGAKSLVLHGDSADRIFVTARVSGDVRDDEGIGLFLVDPAADGVSRRGYPTQDGQRAAELTLENVRVGADDVFGEPGNAMPLVRRVVDQAIAALCSEAVGVMSAMHAFTVAYLKERKQFGGPIGAFQVLQHKAVDMFTALEQARSITLFATMMADSDEAEARARAMHAAKAEIGKAGRLVGETAIQLHGGAGMTMEYHIGHFFKRMTMLDIVFGDSEHHLRALAEQGGLGSTEPALPVLGEHGMTAPNHHRSEARAMEFRKITDEYSVAPQISAADVPAIKEAGFRSVICNRPDAEHPGEASTADEVKVAAEQAGLAFRYIPVISGRMTPQDVADQAAALEALEGPVLAYCRSGTRCTNLFAAINQAGS